MMRRTIGILVCTAVLLSCTSRQESNGGFSMPPQGPTSSPPAQEPHSGWPVHTDRRGGITIQIPPRWSFVWNPLRDGTLGDILMAGSMRFPSRCEPIPRGQVLISLSEHRPFDDESVEGLERDFPPRPRRFETTVLRPSQVGKGCDQLRAQLFRFRDADRFLYAWVMFGRDLPPGLRTKAEAVLSSLEVSRPPRTDGPRSMARTTG
jgi:hypothetical protein